MSADEISADVGVLYLEKAYRFFPPHIEEMASLAFRDPWLPKRETFNIIGKRSPTAVGACEVELTESGLRGFVKPGENITDQKKAKELLIWGAQEKIASDLAYVIGLPVAPCFLAKPLSSMLETVTISLATLPQGRKFSERAQLIDLDHNEIIRMASAMSAFHTFIRDRDHVQNDGNQLIDVLPGSFPVTALSFYDYSHALTYRWDVNNPKPPPQAEGRVFGFDKSIKPDDLSKPEMVKIINKIENLSDSDINGIIHRIPKIMMPPNLKQGLATFLCERRGQLRSIMGLKK